MEPILMLALRLAFAAVSLTGLFNDPTVTPPATLAPTTIVASALPAGLAGATATSPSVAQDAAPTRQDYTVWSGRVRDVAGELREEPMSKTYARDLRQKLAIVRVLVDVDRKFDEASKQLAELWVRASRPGYAERKDVLIDVMLANLSLAEAAGSSTALALDALNHPLVYSSRSNAFELVPVTSADLAMATEIAADSRVVTAKARVGRAMNAASKADTSGDKITDIIHQALERGDTGLTYSLGPRSTPVLASIIEATLDDFPPIANDALNHLIVVDASGAAELVARVFSKGGSIWKARVIRVLYTQGIFSAQTMNLWRNGATAKDVPTFLVPRWFDVLELLLNDPTTRRESVKLLYGIPSRNALTPGLQRAIVGMLTEPGTPLATELLSILREGRGRPSLQPALESVLRSPNADVRAYASSLLTCYERSDALIASIDNSDPVVRTSIASILAPHYVTTPEYPSGETTHYAEPKVTASDRAVLVKLAVDPEMSVRAMAAAAIALLDVPLDAAVYERLSQDAESRVRVAVIDARALPDEQRAKLALGLAGDPDVTVLQRLDRYMLQAFGSGFGDPVPASWLPVLRKRRANTALSYDDKNTGSSGTYDRLSTSADGLALLVEWSATPNGIPPLRVLSNRLGAFNTRNERTNIQASGASWAAAYRLAATLPNDGSYVSFVRYLVREDQVPTAEFLAVAEDPSVGARARLGALAIAGSSDDERVGRLLPEILRGNDVSAALPQRVLTDLIGLVLKRTSESGVGQVLDAIVADKVLSNSVAIGAMNAIIDRHTPTSAQADAILNRWIDNSDALAPVSTALRQVGQRPRAQQGDWLVRATHIGYLSDLAFQLIGDQRDASYVDLLREALSPNFVMSGLAPNYRGAALNALTRYFDQRAAQIILDVAGSTSEAALRDDCFKALETIRKYEAEKGRFERDRRTQEASATAVKELVAMLDDADATVRVQALRALATLGAVEQMPAIVKRLKDPDERVRKAAEAALDTLNAPPAPK